MIDKEKQYKRQNEYIKKNYYQRTVTMPKHYKEFIERTGETANGLINRLLREEFKRLGYESTFKSDSEVQKDAH